MNDLVPYRAGQISPEARTKSLAASLKPVVKSLLSVPVNRDYVDLTYGWDGYVLSYHLPAVIEATEEDLRGALVEVDMAMQTLPDEGMVMEINKLKVRCKMRAEQQEDLEIIIACMIDDLSEYPADVVMGVLKEWPRLSPWWPSWNELYERLERKASPRRAMRDVIKVALQRYEPEEQAEPIDLPIKRLLDNI